MLGLKLSHVSKWVPLTSVWGTWVHPTGSTIYIYIYFSITKMLFPWHNTLIIIILSILTSMGLLHWSFECNCQFNYLNAWSIAKQIYPNLMEFVSIATGLLIEQNLSKWKSPYRNVYLQSQYTFCTFDQHFMKNHLASIITPPKMNLEMCVWM